MNNGRDPTGKGQAGDPTVLACVVFETRDPEQIVQLLHRALTGIAGQAPTEPPTAATLSLQRDSGDPWLKHAEAAEYLGISKSTLYQYACQQKIEQGVRSEEHTSELQSHLNLVCRLLLEKKKKIS